MSEKKVNHHQIWIIHDEELPKASQLRHIALWVNQQEEIEKILQSDTSIGLAQQMRVCWGADLALYDTVETWGERFRSVHVERLPGWNKTGVEVNREKTGVPKGAIPLVAWEKVFIRLEEESVYLKQQILMDLAYAGTMDCWMFPWRGMWLGVERSGHIHS